MGYPVQGSRKPATPQGDLRELVRQEVQAQLGVYLERLQVLLGERGAKDKSQQAVRQGDMAEAVRAELSKVGLP